MFDFEANETRMSRTGITFTLHHRGQTSRETIAVEQAVIAGWTGRDPIAREKHIAELEALGVRRPASTPIYYRVAARRLTTADRIEVSGGESSGEVEFALLRRAGRVFVGVGSDHTDRKVETYNITASKQMCDKPIAADLWDYEDVRNHWDSLILRSWAWFDGVRTLYQEGPVTAMLPPEEIVGGFSGGTALPENTVMFCGTLAAHRGIRPSQKFEYEVEDPVLDRRIRHCYEVIELPVVG
ncbi:conserved hypothetical protein [Hyphomicrobiales bacterium]|nr:conserved hypothetical protein [Hyphomicrobiales bacterium]CAH1671477.1 conserved hypothetical protein [Hyphomicrobiales bacterium]